MNVGVYIWFVAPVSIIHIGFVVFKKAQKEELRQVHVVDEGDLFE